jgi:hypothetical protein
VGGVDFTGKEAKQMKTVTPSKSRSNGADTIQNSIVIPKMEIEMFHVKLVGDSALISHKWSEKAKKEMLDKQMQKPKEAKAAKDPEQCFRDCIYHDDDGRPAFPSVAFKAAAVDACSHIDGVTKVEARGAFHVVGELIPIEGDEPTMREDMVKIAMGTSDIRFRAEFKKWSATLLVRYNKRVLSQEQIIHLFNTAGFAIGVGEWRPQRDGSFGMFHVATAADQ